MKRLVTSVEEAQLKKYARSTAASWTRAQLLEALAEFNVTSAQLKQVEDYYALFSGPDYTTPIEYPLSTAKRRRYRPGCQGEVLKTLVKLATWSREAREEQEEREKDFCTREEIVRECHISHSSFKEYVESGAIIPATKEDKVRGGLYRRESIERVRAEKARKNTSTDDVCTRGEILDEAHINETYFGKYLKMGLIIKHPKLVKGRQMYLRESIENVLKFKAEKNKGEGDE